MEKKLVLTKNNNVYQLSCDDVTILITDKKINTQEIYEKIYSKLTINTDNKVSITITTELNEKEDKHIFGQIKSLFENIDNSINKQLSSNNEQNKNESKKGF